MVIKILFVVIVQQLYKVHNYINKSNNNQQFAGRKHNLISRNEVHKLWKLRLKRTKKE